MRSHTKDMTQEKEVMFKNLYSILQLKRDQYDINDELLYHIIIGIIETVRLIGHKFIRCNIISDQKHYDIILNPMNLEYPGKQFVVIDNIITDIMNIVHIQDYGRINTFNVIKCTNDSIFIKIEVIYY